MSENLAQHELMQAAMAVLGAGSGCTIYSDELNHASIIDGTRLAKLSGATVKVYRHNDMHHLRQLLDQTRFNCRKLVVTDSLFSMDGELAIITLASHLLEIAVGCAMQVSRHALLTLSPSSELTYFSGRPHSLIWDVACTGDFADLQSLAALRQEYGFMLAIDEAHATLVCGERWFPRAHECTLFHIVAISHIH